MLIVLPKHTVTTTPLIFKCILKLNLHAATELLGSN